MLFPPWMIPLLRSVPPRESLRSRSVNSAARLSIGPGKSSSTSEPRSGVKSIFRMNGSSRIDAESGSTGVLIPAEDWTAVALIVFVAGAPDLPRQTGVEAARGRLTYRQDFVPHGAA